MGRRQLISKLKATVDKGNEQREPDGDTRDERRDSTPRTLGEADQWGDLIMMRCVIINPPLVVR